MDTMRALFHPSTFDGHADTDPEPVQYGYDRASNRQWRRNPVAETGRMSFTPMTGFISSGSCSGGR